MAALAPPRLGLTDRGTNPRPRAPRPPQTTGTLPAPNPLAGVITDPGLVATGLSRDQAIQNANALLGQQRSQALIGFGSPSLAGSLGFTVDPNTAAAAQANQYSTVAQLAHQNALANQNILNNLAARHLLTSGQTGYSLGEQARNYGGALYGATNQLLGVLNDYLGQNLGAQQSANQAYQQALLNAFANYGRNPLGTLTSG